MYPMTITLTIQNPAQFTTLAAAIGGTAPVVATTEAAKIELPKAEPNAKKPAAEAAEKPAPAVTEAEPEKQEETAGTAAAVEYATVSKHITESVKSKGRDAVVATFNQFGAAKGPELKPEQYADFIAALGELPDLGA